MKKILLTAAALLAATVPAAAAPHAPDNGARMVHAMTELVFQVGIILVAARLGGILFKKLKMSAVLGELVAGIIIGPYVLGALALPGFPHGLFPLQTGSSIAVSAPLYGLATLASVILLFYAGLETDINLLRQYSLAGTVIGIGGVAVSFAGGAGLVMLMTGYPFSDPRVLLLGTICTATSVGLSTRIFSERKRIDSPEGVTVLAGAVVDDVLGIIVLAVVLGIATLSKNPQNGISAGRILGILGKALGVWLGFTAAGLLLSGTISRVLKRFKSITAFSVVAFGLALILAGIFEKAGLAMIIGAYVMGLALSNSDIRFVITDRLEPVYTLMVPLFFTIMGMLLNIRVLLSPPVLLLGLAYAVVSILTKLAGCGFPALFLNFNRLGALRVGFGMAPRSEVALIIAGTGLSYGLLDSATFGAALMMPLITTLVTPPILDALLRKKGTGTRKRKKSAERETTRFDIPTPELADFLIIKLTASFENEGYFIHKITTGHTMYHFSRDTSTITLNVYDEYIAFDTAPAEATFVKTIMYEALLELHVTVNRLKDIAKPESLRKEVAAGTGQTTAGIGHALDAGCMVPRLTGTSKETVITELVDLLDGAGKLADRAACLQAVLEREKTMSTGMQAGIAIPHGKTDGVAGITVAVGLKKEGLDFQSIDGAPSRIFILVLSPVQTTGPHIRFLAGISAILNDAAIREQLLACTTPGRMYDILAHTSGR